MHSEEIAMGVAAAIDEAAAPADRRPGFRQVAGEQLRSLYVLARRLAGDQAEDVVQECLAEARRGFDDLPDVRAAAGWLRAILVRRALDGAGWEHLRSEQPRLDGPPRGSSVRQTAEEHRRPGSDAADLAALRALSEEGLCEVLHRLQPMCRFPLVLIHMERIPAEHVSQMLGVPLAALLSMLERGRRSFAGRLQGYAEESGLAQSAGRPGRLAR